MYWLLLEKLICMCSSDSIQEDGILKIPLSFSKHFRFLTKKKKDFWLRFGVVRFLAWVPSAFAFRSFIPRPPTPQVRVEMGWVCFASIAPSLSFSILAADAKEKQFWVTQLRACAKYHMEMNSKVSHCGVGWRGGVASAGISLQPSDWLLGGSCFP